MAPDSRRQPRIPHRDLPQAQAAEQKSGELRLIGPEPKRFAVAEGQTGLIASAALPALLRLGSGALCLGYGVSLAKVEPGQYAVASFLGRAVKETSAVGSFNRPKEPLILFEFEGCPFCRQRRGWGAGLGAWEAASDVRPLAVPLRGRAWRQATISHVSHFFQPFPCLMPPPTLRECRKVREAVALLDLDVLFKPCPQGGPTWRPEAIARGGKKQVRLPCCGLAQAARLPGTLSAFLDWAAV